VGDRAHRRHGLKPGNPLLRACEPKLDAPGMHPRSWEVSLGFAVPVALATSAEGDIACAWCDPFDVAPTTAPLLVKIAG
jgi:hypothetical protein